MDYNKAWGTLRSVKTARDDVRKRGGELPAAIDVLIEALEFVLEDSVQDPVWNRIQNRFRAMIIGSAWDVEFSPETSKFVYRSTQRYQGVITRREDFDPKGPRLEIQCFNGQRGWFDVADIVTIMSILV